MHPYSKGLLGSYGDPRAETVRITYVPGRPPDLTQRPPGCAFAPRCPEKIERCTTLDPPLTDLDGGQVACHVAVLQRRGGDGEDEVGERIRTFAGPQFVKTAEDSQDALRGEVLLRVEDVSKVFERRRGFTVTKTEAVTGASFTLRKGEVAALVGQSGSGKSTLARMITGVDSPTSGRIVFHSPEGEQEVSTFKGRALRDYRSHVQMVFQDPYSSLNPAMTLGYAIGRPLANYRKLKGPALKERVNELLETVALTPPERYVNRYAYELSGGQRQRVVIARALAVEPQLIVADEPISSLDVSIRAEILELLNNLVQNSDMGILYITHDLLSARMLSDEVIVLNHGKVVEQGPSLQVIRNPQDPYTRTLLEAVPNPFDNELPQQDAPWVTGSGVTAWRGDSLRHPRRAVVAGAAAPAGPALRRVPPGGHGHRQPHDRLVLRRQPSRRPRLRPRRARRGGRRGRRHRRRRWGAGGTAGAGGLRGRGAPPGAPVPRAGPVAATPTSC